ncbi:Indoleamine 2,3-dioxygenase [Auricularia subglabra TFB-10046 SS5]|nr:Indoleamine 2,3-dioxygenase [Auricularia subglabra TFB-10046 SS5]
MPPIPPLTRLPSPLYDPWEDSLRDAISSRLKPAEGQALSPEDAEASARWRNRVAKLPVIPTDALIHSETLLRRAHHVLTYLLSFYAHSHPRPASGDATPLTIPASVAVPLSTISRQIGIAPVVTYADTVLWNWAHADRDRAEAPLASAAPNLNVLAAWSQPSSSPPSSPTALLRPESPLAAPLPELECLTLFTGLKSEAHFYITSARIELASAAALQLMQRTLDELFLSDAIALRRIASQLSSLAGVIDTMTALLAQMRDGCDPREFYELIRPWFRGGEAWPGGGGFDFAGVTDPEEKERARFSSGASAGQSSIVHALDIFLGTPNTLSPYLQKMEYHMPRHHRAFLRHLRSIPAHATLSALVHSPTVPEAVKTAFNESVMALKRFRDTHIRIATLYIVSQARSSHAQSNASAEKQPEIDKVKGTGGTDLVPFLKNLRDGTARTVVP